MSDYTKEDYLHMARQRAIAFQTIAKRLGKTHQITKMMGSLAWGRHHAETGPQPTLRSAITAAAFLNGFFDCLNLWARDNDYAAQRIMLEVYPDHYEKSPAKLKGQP